MCIFFIVRREMIMFRLLGYARSKNGVKIISAPPNPFIDHAPTLNQNNDGNGSGCEDPRLTRIGNTVYLAYTAYNGVDPWRSALSSISVKDFVANKWDKWSQPQLVTPDPVQDKDTCILPEKVGGQYMLMHRIDPMLCADFLDTLDFKKSRLTRCIEIMGPRPGMWDSQKIGIARPPDKNCQRLAPYLPRRLQNLDLSPRRGPPRSQKSVHRRLAHRSTPIMEPVEEYERVGLTRNAVFSCGAIVRGDNLFIYYGGADTVVAVAKVSLKKLLKILLPDNLA